MGLTILKKKPGYVLGLFFIVVGVIMLLVLIWKVAKAWPDISASPNILSALSEQLLEVEYADIALGIGLKLVHYAVSGVVLLVVGCAILVARRERVPVTEEVTVLLECPYCKNQWRESLSKTHLESMGYPKVRTLSRQKCSKCAKFIRPKIVATKR